MVSFFSSRPTREQRLQKLIEIDERKQIARI
jgi:hypothetical protein